MSSNPPHHTKPLNWIFLGLLVEGLAYFFVSDDVAACADGFDHNVHGLKLDPPTPIASLMIRSNLSRSS